MPQAMKITREAVRLGAVIRRMRQQRGWTVAKLAQRSGMSATYLGIIERGGNLPSLTAIFDLCEALAAHPADVVREVAAERFPETSSSK